MVGKIIGAENTGTAMASRVHVFFKGEEVLPTGTKSATEGVFAYASKLLEQVKAGRKINMIFDIDGVLVKLASDRYVKIAELLKDYGVNISPEELFGVLYGDKDLSSV